MRCSEVRDQSKRLHDWTINFNFNFKHVRRAKNLKVFSRQAREGRGGRCPTYIGGFIGWLLTSALYYYYYLFGTHFRCDQSRGHSPHKIDTNNAPPHTQLHRSHHLAQVLVACKPVLAFLDTPPGMTNQQRPSWPHWARSTSTFSAPVLTH